MNLGIDELRRVALGVTVLLAVVVLWGAGRVLFMAPPEPHLPAESSLNVAGLAGATDEALAPDFTTRPLFWYDRKPYQPPAPEVAAVDVEEDALEMEIDKVQLVGILGAGDQSGIIVSHAGASRRLQLDEEIEGWRFVGLSDGGAQFTNLGRTRVLSMEHASPRAPAKKKDKNAEKTAKKADKKARDTDREKKRAERAESRDRDTGRKERRQPRMTSVWGGPPKQAAPEKQENQNSEE